MSEELKTLNKHQEAIDKRLAVVEAHYANITDTLNQLRKALEKPRESREHFPNEPNQSTELEIDRPAYKESTTGHPDLESSPTQNRAEISSILEAGQHLKGRIKKIIPKSVFVTLDNDKDEGVISIYELTLKPITHPSDVVAPGEEVDVIVINTNQGNGEKLPTLRLKSKHEEWVNRVKEKYQEDSRHRCTVTNVDFEHGIFVEFEKGISGLIHHSNMPDFHEAEKGHEIDVIVSRIDYEKENITLTLDPKANLTGEL